MASRKKAPLGGRGHERSAAQTFRITLTIPDLMRL